MTTIKINDIIKVGKEYSFRHYEFYRVIKVTDKMIKVIELKSISEKKEDITDFYGIHICKCVNEILITGNNPEGRIRNFKKKNITDDMINVLSYEYELYPD
jgi:hypothetical protein